MFSYFFLAAIAQCISRRQRARTNCCCDVFGHNDNSVEHWERRTCSCKSDRENNNNNNKHSFFTAYGHQLSVVLWGGGSEVGVYKLYCCCGARQVRQYKCLGMIPLCRCWSLSGELGVDDNSEGRCTMKGRGGSSVRMGGEWGQKSVFDLGRLQLV